MVNQSTPVGFLLLGFSEHPQLEKVLFVVVLCSYLLTLLGNTLILLLSTLDPRLHSPMYFFLSNLSFLDLCFTTTCVPQMLFNLWGPAKTISFLGCFVQLFIFMSLGTTECILLTVMAFDRYVAVCKPLHYSTIMTQQLCLQLALGSWASGLLVCLVDIAVAFHLPYRGQNIVSHYFCELPALLKVASADTYSTEMAIFAMGVVILLAPVSLILTSYWNIVSTVIQMQSGEGRLKVFSTCGSHLTAVSLFYGTLFVMYAQPGALTSMEQGKVVSIFYTLVIPMLNPLIYSLRNKDVKDALERLRQRQRQKHAAI